MSEFRLTTVEEFEAATARLLETGATSGKIFEKEATIKGGYS